MNKTSTTDFQFFAYYIPNYFVTGTNKNGNKVWRCRSNTGMTDEKWDTFKKEVHNRWPMRFKQFYHITNSDHVDFEIYLSQD